MSALAPTLVSILVLAGLAWLARKAKGLSICPICIGVVGTWGWMLAARLAGFAVDPALLAMLMGASVVGFAHQFEPRLAPQRSRLLWNTLVLPVGFAAVYALVSESWVAAALAALVLTLVAAWFVLPPPRAARTDDAAVKKLEEQMKRCC